MTTFRRAVIYQAVLVAIMLLEVAVYYPKLPDRVASHFGATGVPDGWMSKQAFAAVSIVFPMILAMMMIVAQAVMLSMSRLPASLINLPNKKYWLAPERRDETLAYFIPLTSRFMLWMGTGTTAMLVIIMGMSFQTNLTPEPRLTYALPVVGVFLTIMVAGAVHMTVRVYRRFGRIPE